MRLSPDQPHRGAMDPPAPPPDGQLLRDDDVRAPAVFCLEKCSVNVSKWGLNGGYPNSWMFFFMDNING